MIEINSRNFSKEIFESDKICIVEFGSSYCPPCRATKTVLEELETETAYDLKYCYVDAQKNWTVAKKCAINKLPQVLIFKGNVIKRRIAGGVDKVKLEKLISNVLKSN